MASQAEIARYQELRRQGYSGPQAAEMVWGPGGLARMNEESRKKASSDARMNQFGQLGGTVAGAIGTKYAYNALFPTKEAAAEAVKVSIGKAATGGMTGAVPTTSPVTSTIPYSTPSAPSVSGGGMSMAPGGMSSAPTSSFSQNFKILDPSQMPAGTVAPEGLTAIQSNADGTIKMIPTEAATDPGFMSTANWGAIAQGALGVVQLYGAYKAFKAGDTVGGTLSGATGAANVATAAGADLGTALVPGLNIATGLYTGYQTAAAMGNMAAGGQRNKAGVVGGAAAGASIGAGIGSIVPGVGTAIGAGVGAVIGATVGLVGSWTGAHKGKAQFMRDNIRKVMQEGQILDADFEGTLADGSKYDFGKDGKSMKWDQIDQVAAANPGAWSSTVGLTDALAASYGYVGQKASDISAWYAKAAVSNAGDDAEKAKSNVRHFAQQQGLSLEGVKQKLDEAIADTRITQTQYDAYMNGANQLFAGMPSAPGAPGTPTQNRAIRMVRPEKGKVGRVSAGMYRTDTGALQAAPTMRQALEKAYRKGDGTATISKKG